ncbi:MAG: ABC transporter permease [Siphonobacter sp.]
MFRNYIKIAFRNLWRNRRTTSINVLGLAVGISACIVIFLLVDFEFGFDRHHPDTDRIYRLVSEFKFGDDPGHNGGVSAPIPEALRRELTGIENVAALHTTDFSQIEVTRPGQQPLQFKSGNDRTSEAVYVDNHFFQIIPSEWLAGSAQTSLSKPNQVVLTQTQAQRYFGEASDALIGRTLRTITFRDTIDLTVSGLVKDAVHRSDFSYPAYISLATITTNEKRRKSFGFEEWTNTNGSSMCLVKLQPDVNPNQLEKRITQLADSHSGKLTFEWKRWFWLQPLTDVHFNQIYSNGIRVAHKPTLYGLTAVGIFLLVLASINFVNLATAQASQRVKEIGIRKTLGSRKSQLVSQLLGETLLVTLVATLLSIVLAELALTYLAELVPIEVVLHVDSPRFWAFLIGISLVTSLLSGIYPGILISRFSPVETLRGNKLFTSTGKVSLRRVLIISQFVIAQIFIIGALFVSRQLQFMIQKDLGFEREAIVTFHVPYKYFWLDDHDKRFTLADQIRKLSGVKQVSMANQLPISNNWSSSTMNFQRKKEKVAINVYRKVGDTNYLSIYGFHLLAGRNFAKSDTTNEFVINETLAKQMGFQHPGEAVGQFLEYNNGSKIPIVGVVQDFHNRSLHEIIQPTALMNDRSSLYDFTIKLESGSAQKFDATLAQIKKLWDETYLGDSFSYTFFDDEIARLYNKERNLVKLTNLATGIAIFISCLGLFGLVTFTAERRTKEIGIRKVLGASVTQLVTLLSKEFLVLVGLAFILAAPIAWYFLREWLNGFAYRTELSWWLFASAGILALFVALLTVSSQAIRAANADPVKSLKSE